MVVSGKGKPRQPRLLLERRARVRQGSRKGALSTACGKLWGQRVRNAVTGVKKDVESADAGCFRPRWWVLVGMASYGGDMAEIEVRRSTRRSRTVSARREGDLTIVMIPAAMSKRDERRAVADMIAKLDARDRNRVVARSDESLLRRAGELAANHVPEAPRPNSVRWVTNQNLRWGSCTPVDRTIRLSHRLQDMPDHVIDAVLIHEIAHLVVAGHGPRFDAVVNRYPRMAEAMGFLEGVTWQQRREP